MNLAATDPEVIARIRERYLAEPDTKVETLAVEEGVSKTIVIKATADLPRRNAWQERRRMQAIELASLGKRVDDIARQLKCPIRTVRHALAAPPPPPPTAEQLADATEKQRLESNANRRAGYARRKALQKATPEPGP